VTAPDTLDSLLGELEKAIATLTDGSAPLEDLVEAHRRAVRLLARAQDSFRQLKERADEATKLLQ
jgi:exodeoxyribonuclease VII small subunit